MEIRLFILFFFFFLITICLESQAQVNDNYVIKGVVTDSISEEVIPYATVSVSYATDPLNYIKRVLTDVDGQFKLELENAGAYLIVFEWVEMKPLWRQLLIEEEKKIYDLGKVKMLISDELLDELTVVAAKPLVKMDLDKIIYDTESDPEAKSTTVLEMLRKVPMVTVDGEDNIQVKGSSNFKVYMNGKPSSITATNPSQVLKSLPASTVKNIEVITEPGVKYDAEGVGGIINIVTEKALRGYTGTIQAGIESNGSYYGGAYFSTKIGKLGLTANTTYYHYQDDGRKVETNRINENPNPYKYLHERSFVDVDYNYHLVSLEASYEFDSLNLMNLSITKNGSVQNFAVNGYVNELLENMDTLSLYSQANRNKNNWGGLNLNLDYQRSFRKPNKLLTMSYQLGMSPIKTKNKTIINNIIGYRNSNNLISVLGQSDEHTFQIDYVEPFNKKHVIEAGMKYILRLNNSENSYKVFENGEYVEDTTYNSKKGDLNQTQHILGTYGSYTFKMDKFSARAGARYEYTNSLVRFVGEREKNFDKPFSNLIPSVLLSYQPTVTSNLQLSYTQRISRPGINYLNPFEDNSNPNLIKKGNPNLKAEISNTFNLGYGMFSQKLSLNAGLFYSFISNAIEEVISIRNNGVMEQTYENIGSSSQAGINIYANWFPLKSLRLYTNSFFNYINYKADFAQKDGLNYGIMGGALIELPWNLKWNINGGYYSPWISLEGEGSPYYFLGTSLGRDFFKNKLNVTLRVKEPFREKREFKYTLKREGMYKSDSRQIFNAFSFGISLSYRFGEMKEQIKKAKRGITNDDVKSSNQGGKTSGVNTSTQ